jgi:hypothetical protein
MYSAVRRHLIYQISHTPVRNYPFPHLVVDDVFPPDFYARIQAFLPDDDGYVPLVDTGRVGGGYSRQRLALFESQAKSNRLSADQQEFWIETFAALHHIDLGAWVMAKFYDVISARLGLENPAAHTDLKSEIFLMRDLENYLLGPHTDSPSKVVSVLFYLPRNANRVDLGTSLYAPKDPTFRCEGGPHHNHAKFDRITTIPYKPNTMIAFPKTDDCFHGVEPVEGERARRDILFFDLKLPEQIRH